MSIPPLRDSATTGIGRGLDGLRTNAARIAGAGQQPHKFPTRDSVRAMVELHANAPQVSISVAAFRAADKVLGSLLDVKA